MKKLVAAGVGAFFALAGCGGGDKGGAPNPKNIAQEIANPTGTLTEDNVDDVINEFIALLEGEETIPSTPMFSPQEEYCYGDICCDVSGNSVTCDCPDGGSVKVKVDTGCEKDCTVEFSYNDCTYEDCAIDGSGAIWMAGSIYQPTGEMAYVFSGSVCGEPVEISYYFDGTDYWYLVEVEGKTFAVKGWYNDGDGKVWIKDSTGEEYYCQIVENAATCEGL